MKRLRLHEKWREASTAEQTFRDKDNTVKIVFKALY